MKRTIGLVLALVLLGGSALAGEATGAGAAGGDEQSVLIELDGTASYDPDGDKLQYRWKQVAGPPIALSDATKAKPYFRAREAGTYRFELVVHDGRRVSKPALVEVVVEQENLPPVARLPKDLRVDAGQPIRVDGSGSHDPDGDRLQYHWRQVGGPPLYLDPQTATGQVLSLPSVEPGVYELALQVSDGRARSETARCRVVVAPPNQAPQAQAHAPRVATLSRSVVDRLAVAPASAPTAVILGDNFAQLGSRVSFDGRSSLSPEGRPLEFIWKQTGGPFLRTYERPTDGMVAFVPQEAGVYTFELVVNDGERESDPVRRSVRVAKTNEPPVAVADAPAIAAVGTTVTLDGARSFDREGSSLRYQWKQVAGPNVTRWIMDEERGEKAPSFVPEKAGEYAFELIVSDGETDSLPARTVVQVQSVNRRPSVEVTRRLELTTGESAVLHAAGKDEDGDLLSYRWKQVRGPMLLEREATQQTLTVTPKEPGAYVFECIAADGSADSGPVRCTLTVKSPETGGEMPFVATGERGSAERAAAITTVAPVDSGAVRKSHAPAAVEPQLPHVPGLAEQLERERVKSESVPNRIPVRRFDQRPTQPLAPARRYEEGVLSGGPGELDWLD